MGAGANLTVESERGVGPGKRRLPRHAGEFSSRIEGLVVEVREHR